MTSFRGCSLCYFVLCLTAHQHKKAISAKNRWRYNRSERVMTVNKIARRMIKPMVVKRLWWSYSAIKAVSFIKVKNDMVAIFGDKTQFLLQNQRCNYKINDATWGDIAKQVLQVWDSEMIGTDCIPRLTTQCSTVSWVWHALHWGGLSLVKRYPCEQSNRLQLNTAKLKSYGVHWLAGSIRFRRYRLQSDRTVPYQLAPYVTSAIISNQTFRWDHMLKKQFWAVLLNYDKSVPSSGQFQGLSCSHWLYRWCLHASITVAGLWLALRVIWWTYFSRCLMRQHG